MSQAEHMIYAGDSFGYGSYMGESPMTVDQVIDRLNLGPVNTAPIFLENGEKIPTHVAMQRNDQTYSVVGSGFTPVQDRDAFGLFETLPIMAAGRQRGGARVWIQSKIGGSEIIPGDQVDQYLMLSNSHDGSGALRIFSVRKRSICNNQIAALLRTNRGRGVSIKHTRNVNDRLEEIKNIIELSQMYHANQDEFERRLANTPMSREMFDNFCHQLIPDPPPRERKNAKKETVVQAPDHVIGRSVLNEMLENETAKKQESEMIRVVSRAQNNTRAENNRRQLWDLLDNGQGQSLSTPDGRPVNQTLWGARNALTEYVNYHKGTRRTNGASEEERRVESTIFGAGNTMIHSGDSILLEMLDA